MSQEENPRPEHNYFLSFKNNGKNLPSPSNRRRIARIDSRSTDQELDRIRRLIAVMHVKKHEDLRKPSVKYKVLSLVDDPDTFPSADLEDYVSALLERIAHESKQGE